MTVIKKKKERKKLISAQVIEDKKIWKKLLKQVLFIIPSIVIVAVVGFKGVSAVMVEHYTQVIPSSPYSSMSSPYSLFC
jgi:hypothetical protein